MILGPRIGKFNKDGTPNAFPGHNLGYVVIGTLVLMFGWMGFNPGSTFGATDLRIAVVAVNTLLVGVRRLRRSRWPGPNAKCGKPDISMSCNGMLAGLVAITAPCAFVAPWAAAVIGIVAGFLVCYGVWFFDHVAHVDDPCGAISVHGVCGAWGVLAVGLFADGTYGDGWNGVGRQRQGPFYGDGRPARRADRRRRRRLRLGLGRHVGDLHGRQALHADPGVPEAEIEGSTCPSSARCATRTSSCTAPPLAMS